MSTSQVVRWEILPGLPGEGPPPKYFFVGHATPWVEGLVVRFGNANGTAWTGNFQGRQDWSTKVVLWPEADAVVVIAVDNFFLVNASDPDDYVTVEARFLVDEVMLDEGRTMLFVAASTTIFAYRRDRQLLWTRTALGGLRCITQSTGQTNSKHGTDELKARDRRDDHCCQPLWPRPHRRGPSARPAT